jgi:hypothetical protein
MLVGPVEDRRREDRAEHAAEHPADRHGEVESGEMRRFRPPPVHLGMEGDGDDEEQ